MPRLPRLRGREVIASLRRAGFAVLRVRGSHHFMQHPDGRRTVVPVHAGETIGEKGHDATTPEDGRRSTLISEGFLVNPIAA